MSRYELLRATLESIARTISEDVDEQGYTVDAAMEVNLRFNNALARTLLFRDIVLEAASIAASQSGHIDFRPVNGSGRELRAIVGNVDRRYRIKRAGKSDGEWQIRANSDSALSATVDSGDELFPAFTEQWVLGWALDEHDKIAEVFAAQVTGVTPGKPAWLILGRRESLLTGPNNHDTGFYPAEDDDLPGFQSEADDEEEDGVSS